MSETRLFRYCLLASLLINGVAFVVAGWLGRPPTLSTPLTVFSHIRLVTLPPPPPPAPKPVPVAAAPPPTPPRPAPVRRMVRIVPKPHAPKPPRPKKRTRPGARVHSSSPAPLAAPAGGSDAGSPAPSPVVAAPTPAPPTPDVLVSPKSPSRLVAHNVQAPPTMTPTPSASAGTAPAAPTVAPPVKAAPASGQATGGDAAGKGAGSGEGMGTGQGIGKGKSADAGEPFGVGKGLAGDGGPRHVVYVLDISGSMTSRIDRAEDELRHALAGLQAGETFNVVAFSDDARAFAAGMAPATPEVKRRADGFLATLQVTGGTNLEAAMRLALSRPGVNEVVLLTDGVPTNDDGPYPPEEFPRIAREIDRMNTQRAHISTIGLVGVSPDGKNQSFEATRLLKQIAHDSGGACKLVTLGTADPE